jgi:hypothetical protein
MEIVYLVTGVVLLIAALVDVLWTTLWPDGGSGPLSGLLTTLVWRLMRLIGRFWDRALSLAGPFVLAATLIMWIAMLWAGWVLLFAADSDSLIPKAGTDVSWSGRIYFVAYSMFTMGNGDFSPAEGWAQLATSLTTATGMVIVTASVTYLLSVIPAVAQKRAFAASVTALGDRPADVVASAWNGRDFHALDLRLSTLASDLGVLADKHKAFPVLHYYHAADRSDASAIAVALLDEALTVIEHGVAAQGCNPVAFRTARASADGYLSTLHSAYLTPATEAPASPDLARLRAIGVPTVDDEQFHTAVDALADRRRALLGVVQGDAWEWPA